MLGAVKGDGAAGGIPLFRMLARRWVPLAPVKRERATFAAMSPADEQPKSTRRWISKPSQYPGFVRPLETAKPPIWNPWLWVK